MCYRTQTAPKSNGECNIRGCFVKTEHHGGVLCRNLMEAYDGTHGVWTHVWSAPMCYGTQTAPKSNGKCNIRGSFSQNRTSQGVLCRNLANKLHLWLNWTQIQLGTAAIGLPKGGLQDGRGAHSNRWAMWGLQTNIKKSLDGAVSENGWIL